MACGKSFHRKRSRWWSIPVTICCGGGFTFLRISIPSPTFSQACLAANAVGALKATLFSAFRRWYNSANPLGSTPRSRSRHAFAAFTASGGGQDPFRSHVNDLRQTGGKSAHSAHERFASGDACGYAFRRVELRRIFRPALVSGSRELSAVCRSY